MANVDETKKTDDDDDDRAPKKGGLLSCRVDLDILEENKFQDFLQREISVDCFIKTFVGITLQELSRLTENYATTSVKMKAKVCEVNTVQSKENLIFVSHRHGFSRCLEFFLLLKIPVENCKFNVIIAHNTGVVFEVIRRKRLMGLGYILTACKAIPLLRPYTSALAATKLLENPQTPASSEVRNKNANITIDPKNKQDVKFLVLTRLHDHNLLVFRDGHLFVNFHHLYYHK